MVTIGDVLAFLGEGIRILRVVGAEEHVLTSPAPAGTARPDQFAFIGTLARNPLDLALATHAGLCILPEGGGLPVERMMAENGIKAIVFADNPRLLYMQVLRRFFVDVLPAAVHPSAVVSPDAVIGKNVFIGPLCVIDAGVVVGDDSVIHSGVHIHAEAKLGKGVIIHSGTVIGADGFGYERNPEGGFEKFPHVGSVRIEDDVEIGANTCIDRGTLADTVIRTGARIDNLVHIAHNVIVGRHSAIIAHSMIGGSTVIGDYCWVAPSSCLRDQLVVGQGVTVGLGSVVTKGVAEGVTVFGVPARTAEEHKKKG